MKAIGLDIDTALRSVRGALLFYGRKLELQVWYGSCSTLVVP